MPVLSYDDKHSAISIKISFEEHDVYGKFVYLKHSHIHINGYNILPRFFEPETLKDIDFINSIVRLLTSQLLWRCYVSDLKHLPQCKQEQNLNKAFFILSTKVYPHNIMNGYQFDKCNYVLFLYFVKNTMDKLCSLAHYYNYIPIMTACQVYS